MSSLQHSVDTLQKLVGHPSVSSTSNTAVSETASEALAALGFDVEKTNYLDPQGVPKMNLVARRQPTATGSTEDGGLAYFCHTDVVPADDWTGPGGDPFKSVVQKDRIYGRGSCDMKGSLVAMLSAVARLPAKQQRAPLWIVCTADEEVGFLGAKDLVHNSTEYRNIVRSQPLAIIGEPTRLSVVHAHKGIVGMRITSQGKAAHSSTKDGINANEAMVPMMQTLLDIRQQTEQSEAYHDNRFNPPVLSWNFGISDGCKAVNITPAKSVAWVSLRPMPNIDGRDLMAAVEEKAKALGLQYQVCEGGSPLWIDPEVACIQELCELAGGSAKTVCYGTDGGEFNELKHRVVCGPGDIAQAHTSDEWLELEQLSKGIDLYEKAVRFWCSDTEGRVPSKR
ncbi:M20 family metallopeptidase [bacterium]|nr:M20 family metallopeptidase [bacterium]MDB4664373.1 M20 family metallopeptidase [bacterium]